MSYQMFQAMTVFNLVICMSIMWACFCRLNSWVCKKYILARLKYTILLAGSLASGFQPLFFKSFPNWADALFGTSVLIALALDVARWKRSIHPLRRSTDQ